MATLEEIAAEVGVSKWTVSRVLNGEAEYQRPTFAKRAEKIRAIARKMGYQPNAAAKAVATGRFGNICLLCSTVSGQSRLPQKLLDSIHHALARRDLSLTVAALPDADLTDPSRVPRILRERMADGLLINYTHNIPPRMKQLIHSHAGASIWLNARLEEDCVHPDDLGGGMLATRHLIDRGHRDIAYVDYIHGWRELDEAHYSARDRQRGYELAMREAGLTPRIIRYDEHVHTPDRLAASQAWLRRSDRPRAVVAYGGAAEIVFAAAELGLSMPDDLPIVAIGDQIAPSGIGPLDTVMVEFGGLGETAVGALLTKLKEPDESLPPQAVSMIMRLAEARNSPKCRRPRAEDFARELTNGPASSMPGDPQEQ